MNEVTDGSRGRQRWAGVMAAAVAGIALLVAACGGSGSSTAAGAPAYQKALAYAQCMRSHGESGWPDPTSQGRFSTSQINMNSPQFFSALSGCHSLQPAGDQFQLSGAQQQEFTSIFLKMAACMRSHGITNFADPVMDDGHAILSLKGIDRNSPFFLSAQKTCEALLPKGL